MLVYQAAAQLELWSGENAPIDVMAKAFDEAGE
jgi:shikimate 5-dehydrogenase